MWSMPYMSTPPFQFHKGAIRTGDIYGKASSVNEFQFHKGAIRTYV